MSRRCPGPSPTTTSRAPALRNALAAPATTSGCVLMAAAGAYSTRLGFSRTDRPRTFTPSSRNPRDDHVGQLDRIARGGKQSDGGSRRNAEVGFVERRRGGTRPRRPPRRRRPGIRGESDPPPRQRPLRRDSEGKCGHSMTCLGERVETAGKRDGAAHRLRQFQS